MVEVIFLAVGKELNEGHRAGEVVEDDDVFIEDIEHVWSVVLALRLVLDGNLLKVADGIEGGVAVETAVLRGGAADREVGEEVLEGSDDIAAKQTLGRG